MLSKIYFVFIYLYVSVYCEELGAVWVSEFMCLQMAEEYVRSPEVGNRDSCETPRMGDGNQTQIISKNGYVLITAEPSSLLSQYRTS